MLGPVPVIETVPIRILPSSPLRTAARAAMAKATTTSILWDAFYLAMRQPRVVSTAIARWIARRTSGSGYATMPCALISS
jgi:hypothetical protein